jgi:hypothetical protein
MICGGNKNAEVILLFINSVQCPVLIFAFLLHYLTVKGYDIIKNECLIGGYRGISNVLPLKYFSVGFVQMPFYHIKEAHQSLNSFPNIL